MSLTLTESPPQVEIDPLSNSKRIFSIEELYAPENQIESPELNWRSKVMQSFTNWLIKGLERDWQKFGENNYTPKTRRSILRLSRRTGSMDRYSMFDNERVLESSFTEIAEAFPIFNELARINVDSQSPLNDLSPLVVKQLAVEEILWQQGHHPGDPELQRVLKNMAIDTAIVLAIGPVGYLALIGISVHDPSAITRALVGFDTLAGNIFGTGSIEKFLYLASVRGILPFLVNKDKRTSSFLLEKLKLSLVPSIGFLAAIAGLVVATEDIDAREIVTARLTQLIRNNLIVRKLRKAANASEELLLRKLEKALANRPMNGIIDADLLSAFDDIAHEKEISEVA